MGVAHYTIITNVRAFRLIFILFVAMLALLLLKKPIEFYLNKALTDKLTSDLIAGSVSRLFVILLGVSVIVRYRLGAFNGLTSSFRINNPHSLIFPSIVIGAALYSNIDFYLSTPALLFLIFLTYAFIVGFSEEIMFRGIFFPLLITANSRKWQVYKAAIISSLLFGLVHYINLLKQPDNFRGVTSQVIFAFSLGVFLTGLLLRTNNIVPVALIHSLINLGFGSGQINRAIAESSSHIGAGKSNIGSVIFTLFIFGGILASGLYMIMKTNAKDVLERVKQNNFYKGAGDTENKTLDKINRNSETEVIS